MGKLLKKLYIKWVLGQCRDICTLCPFRNECDDNFDEPIWSNLLKQRKNK